MPDRSCRRRRHRWTKGTDGIAAAIDLCAGAEAVVLCLGESAAMSGEAASRVDIGLPGRQRALAEAVLALGKPVVVTLSSGRPLTAPWLFERADAVLATWFLGHEAGNAVADVLTGTFNPTGRLPVSWPRDVGQVPIFYNELPSGRPYAPGVHYSSTYLDLPPTPQFPFRPRPLIQPLCAKRSSLQADPSEAGRHDRGVACGSQ